MVRTLLIAALLAAPALVLADPPAGQIDPTFGSFDGGVLGLQLEGFDPGPDEQVSAIVQDTQGRLLVVGRSQSQGRCLGLMRFTPEGQLDTSDFGFDANHIAQGKICHPILMEGSLGYVSNIALLPDGGFFVGTKVAKQPYICRFRADGEKMDSFNGSGCITLPQIESGYEAAPNLLVQGASLLIVANRTDTVTTPVLVRLSIDSGAIEPFGQQDFVPILSSNADALVLDAVLADDGDVLVAGRIEVNAGDEDGLIARFDMQQTQPDLGFSGDGMARYQFNKVPAGEDVLRAIKPLPNGEILVAGSVEMSDRSGIALVQLDAATGAWSDAFNGGLPKTYDPCSAVPGGCNDLNIYEVAWTSAHIVVSGADDDDVFAARVDVNGNKDMQFGQQGLARVTVDIPGGGPMDMVMQGERIVLASAFNVGDNETDFGLVRLSDGRLFRDQFEVVVP